MMLDWEKVIDKLLVDSEALLDEAERTRHLREARMAASITLSRLAFALQKGIVTDSSLSSVRIPTRA